MALQSGNLITAYPHKDHRPPLPWEYNSNRKIIWLSRHKLTLDQQRLLSLAHGHILIVWQPQRFRDKNHFLSELDRYLYNNYLPYIVAPRAWIHEAWQNRSFGHFNGYYTYTHFLPWKVIDLNCRLNGRVVTITP